MVSIGIQVHRGVIDAFDSTCLFCVVDFIFGLVDDNLSRQKKSNFINDEGQGPTKIMKVSSDFFRHQLLLLL